MIPSDFRLDTVSVHLVERLEGARRSYMDRPDEAPPAFLRIAEELVADAASEVSEYTDDAEYPAVLRREILETFLPRYTRLALEHNALEKERFGAWRRGDPIARMITTGAAVFAAALFSRFFPSVFAAVAWVAVLLVGLMPELRTAWYRRLYQRDLQAVVDDMARIHDHLDVYTPSARQAGSEPASSAQATVSERSSLDRNPAAAFDEAFHKRRRGAAAAATKRKE
jgi:hypothetical protein